ncbi:MAG: 1-acyl-sn-glycerol-3-phosphate acyltransferase [Bacteroidales bacterium]|nr:1-acyl-sn-glycerol-3-phosphate acyltransferase [Bacteroidales bacterium]
MVSKVVFWHKLIAATFRFFLSLRYRWHISGEEILKDKKLKIFFPNHPALIDPILLTSIIYKYANVAPAISAKYYRNKSFLPLLKLINAIPVADLSEGERDVNVYTKMSQMARLEFKKGHHLLLYPAGQLAAQEHEKLFNKQGAFRIVSELNDDIEIIGVRIKGFWGSRWSKYGNTKTPDFAKTLLASFRYLALRGFFFCPKRPVYFEFVDLTEKLKELSHTDRKTFNAFLERFYNESEI